MSNQPFTITSTYNPSTGTITCSTSSVTVGQGNTGKITVNLQLTSGSSGSIAFQGNPNQVTWSTTPPASFNVTSTSSTQILITAPNGNSNPGSQSYSFQINYTYTPTSGPSTSGTGDPTIILDGTGSDAKDHASEQGKSHGKGV